MLAIRYAVLVAACLAINMGSSVVFAAEEASRRIEEVVVTAERRESTVSDTSISITAFGEDMIEDLGMQGADELVNFTPSTTRDAYDIRIRGVGRNFRALGGDPGVATYYNGVYSEDFGIASSESALYDVQRIEVLRGPQGTLYGRNSIGGALNYITNRPNFDEVDAEIRFQGGNLGTQEWYGMLSGPLIKDRLAYRFTGVRQDRDESQDGLDGSEDVNNVADQNLAIALEWRVTDNQNFYVRYNDRDLDNTFGQPVNVSEGPITDGPNTTRGIRNPAVYTQGLVAAPFGYVDNPSNPILNFTDPNTGSPFQAIYARPGFDTAQSIRPSYSYGVNPDIFQPDVEDLGGDALTNNRNDQTFNHNAVQAEYSWDLNESMQIKWIGGWSDFDYTFFQDFDRSTSQLTQYHQKVKQSLENWSQEMQFFWDVSDKLQVTTGIFYFDQDLRQQYSVADDFAQGRFTRPANYGSLAPFLAGFGNQKNLGDAEFGEGLLGQWNEGVAGGDTYAIDNTVNTEAFAVYSQGTYTFNEEWALTLGVRYAKDQKDAKENRFAYIEDDVNDPEGILNGLGFQAIWDGTCSFFAGIAVTCEQIGLTNLGVANIMMGNALPTFDPTNPLLPTCALDDPDCATPLRLSGVPLSFSEASQGKDEWDDINFRVNLDWSPNDNTLIYAGVTTGYRSGGYSLGLLGTQTAELDENGEPIPLTTSAPRSYDDETVVAYEIGYKGSLFNDTLQLFSSLYFYQYDGYQDEVEEFNETTGVGDNVVINAGDAQNWGWELEGVWLPMDNWTIGGNYSYTQTEYQDNILVVEEDDPARPLSLFGGAVIDLEGNDLKRIPDHKATVYSFYDINFAPGTVSLGGSFAYTGQFYDSGINRDLDRVRSRYRLDLSATWRDNRDRWVVRTFIDNVTDEGVARGIGTAGQGQNWQQTGTYLYPRYYGVDVTYRFGHLL